MLTSNDCPTPIGFGVKLMWASVSKVTSGVTPAGSAIEDELCTFVGVTPVGSVVCASVGVVIRIREAIERITTIVAVTFAVFLDKFNFLFSFSLFAKLGKNSANLQVSTRVAN